LKLLGEQRKATAQQSRKSMNQNITLPVAATHLPQRKQRYYFMCYDVIAAFLDSADQALIIQRLHYWLQNEEAGYHMGDGCKWIFNGYKEWLEQFTWMSVDQFGRNIRYLEKIEWVVTARFDELKNEIGFVSKPPLLHSYNRRKWYRLNYQKIFEDTGFDLLFEKYGKATGEPPKRKVEPPQSLKPAPLSNLQECRLGDADLQMTICDVADSSIYKENPKNNQIKEVVFFKKDENQEKELSPDSHEVDEDELESVDSLCTDGLSESPTLRATDPNGGKSSAAAPDFFKPNQLKLMGVKLDDEDLLLAAALVSRDDLADAVEAFLEYCKTKEVKKPTSCLVMAIKRGWKPENPLQRSENANVDPVEVSLIMWCSRWDKVPMARPQMKRDIEAEFPNGEIVVNDLEVGPVRGTVFAHAQRDL
jgi:hypothetical protein